MVKDAWTYEYSNDTPLRPYYERIPRPRDEQCRCDYGRIVEKSLRKKYMYRMPYFADSKRNTIFNSKNS